MEDAVHVHSEDDHLFEKEQVFEKDQIMITQNN